MNTQKHEAGQYYYTNIDHFLNQKTLILEINGKESGNFEVVNSQTFKSWDDMKNAQNE